MFYGVWFTVKSSPKYLYEGNADGRSEDEGSERGDCISCSADEDLTRYLQHCDPIGVDRSSTQEQIKEVMADHRDHTSQDEHAHLKLGTIPVAFVDQLVCVARRHSRLVVVDHFILAYIKLWTWL